jgi:hypothetical protein
MLRGPHPRQASPRRQLERREQVSDQNGAHPAAAPVPLRNGRISTGLNRRARLWAAAIWLPGIGVMRVKSRDRLTRPLRTGIPAASTPPGAPFHEIGRPAERVSWVPGIANGGCMDDPCVPRHRRRSQQRRNNQRSANKSEFHHGFLPFAVSRVLFSQRPTHSAPCANNAIRFLFQFAAQPAQIAVMATQAQIAAAGISHPCGACGLRPA